MDNYKRQEMNFFYGEDPHPLHPPVLDKMPPQPPPAHTQIQPRCFTCKHFEMCKYKQDYLKTITLMQNDLGAPARSLELVKHYITIPHFVGFPFFNQDDYFPAEVEFDNSDDKGRLFLARFNGINYVNVIYISRCYYILLELVYNSESELYELHSCKEAFYGVEYQLNKKSLEKIQLSLVDWREMIINTRTPIKPFWHCKDVINTTHFSASLNCDMYEWNKIPFEEAIEKMCRKYPYGIPLDECGRAMYHIATYHIENGEVPYSPLFYGKKPSCGLTPYIPPQAVCKPSAPPRRRGDM